MRDEDVHSIGREGEYERNRESTYTDRLAL